MELRPYQTDAIEALFFWFRRNKTGAPIIVLPTGAGKSLVAAEIVRRTIEFKPDARLLLLAHRRELLSQLTEEIVKHCPQVSLGVYSAGLGARQLGRRVTVAGVQSVWKRAADLGPQTLCLVDEVHLVKPDEEGMYRTLLAGLTTMNPAMRLAGLTASPYRMGSGMLTDDGGLFTAIAYEAPVRELIDQGYLSPLRSKSPRAQVDMTGVHLRGGEYVANEMAAKFDLRTVTDAALDEVFQYGKDRKSWLVFCASVQHAENVTKAIRARGVEAECIVGETESLFREQHITRFRRGELRCIVNVDVLTTGFNAPNVDLIVILRATKSIGLFVQMVGRGLRRAEGKVDCLIADHGHNLEEHGPIDKIRITRRTNPLTGQEEARVERAPIKVCPLCREAVIASTRECSCGYQFPGRDTSHSPTASSAPILHERQPPVRYEVSSIDYRRHEKAGRPPSLRVEYIITTIGNIKMLTFSEWVCLEHGGFATFNAIKWWRSRAINQGPVPETVEEALTRLGELRRPRWISVQKDGKFDRVVGVEFDEEAEREAEEDRKWLEEQGLNL